MPYVLLGLLFLVCGCSQEQPYYPQERIELDFNIRFPDPPKEEEQKEDSGTPADNDVLEVKDEKLDNLKSSGETVVVTFSSPTCVPCHLLRPKLDTMADNHPDVKFYYVNIMENPDMFSEASMLPTTRIYKGGNMVKEIVGNKPEEIEGGL